MCSYFFLQAFSLLRPTGQLGLVATNSISEGDTRESGLQHIIKSGGIVFTAVRSRKWPGQASLEVAHVWIRKGAWIAPCTLDGQHVTKITAFLLAEEHLFSTPHRLHENMGWGLEGSHVNGLGFMLEPLEAKRLIDQDKKNRNVIFPFLNGEDLNSSPTQKASRWVINFSDWPLKRLTSNRSDKDESANGIVKMDYVGPVAADFPDCLAIVEERAKPERELNGSETLRRLWWRFKRPTIDLYNAICGSARVLVCSEVTKHLAFCFVQNGMVYSANLAVFPKASLAAFAVLQSSIHDLWARTFSSHLETRLKYSQGNAFETFPFPTAYKDFGHVNPTESNLAVLGEQYHEFRQQSLSDRNIGLTTIYNRFHAANESSADIQKLRQLHIKMDNAVTAAYGWTDLDLDHGFHETKQGVRYTISEVARREALTRLLKLNHERYDAEVNRGLHAKKKPKSSKKSAKTDDGVTLFESQGEE